MPNQSKTDWAFFLSAQIPSICVPDNYRDCVNKKKTQPLRPYKSVLICAPDNYRGCVVCASSARANRHT